MSSKIALTIVKGKLKGGKFGIDEPMSCVIGRDDFCTIKIPREFDNQVSRHHCLLTITPPDIAIQDLGSTNGTFVNGVRIGIKEESSDDITPHPDSKSVVEYLKDGDEFKIGETVIQVNISASAVCSECFDSIPEKLRGKSKIEPGVYVCGKCRKKTRLTLKKPKLAKTIPVCAICGKDVSLEKHQQRYGDYICEECRLNSTGIISRLTNREETIPKDADKSLVEIKGYRVIRLLGKGGMGAVYLTMDEKNKIKVALKMMLPQVAVDKNAKTNFLRETKNTKALRHPNIVQMLNSGYSNGTFFFTMEYCDGGTVEDLMKTRGGTLPLEEALGIIFQALEGIEYAHHAKIPCAKVENGKAIAGNGVIHHDLKPENLFLCSQADGSQIVKIGDFGLAKAFNMAGLGGCQPENQIDGTLAFIPRQQLINTHYCQADLDVYALAGSLYYMISKRLPRNFDLSNPIKSILQTTPVPILKRNPLVPEKIAAVIDEALIDTDKDLRFKTAQEFKEALMSAL